MICFCDRRGANWRSKRDCLPGTQQHLALAQQQRPTERREGTTYQTRGDNIQSRLCDKTRYIIIMAGGCCSRCDNIIADVGCVATTWFDCCSCCDNMIRLLLVFLRHDNSCCSCCNNMIRLLLVLRQHDNSCCSCWDNMITAVARVETPWFSYWLCCDTMIQLLFHVRQHDSAVTRVV